MPVLSPYIWSLNMGNDIFYFRQMQTLLKIIDCVRYHILQLRGIKTDIYHDYVTSRP